MNSIFSPVSQMFGWLHLPRWGTGITELQPTAQPIVTQAEMQARHLAFHRAYQRFAQQQPAWVARRFDVNFLRQVTDTAELPSGLALAMAWDRQFGPLSPVHVRCQQITELAVVAKTFLSFYQNEMLQTTKSVA